MAKKSQKYLSYLLSIGFTMLIFLFLVVLVLISRVVLSDVSPVSEHVINTKNLLENIEEVEKVAHINSSASMEDFNQEDIERLYKKNSYINEYVLDANHKNLKDKSIFTVFFKEQIEKVNNAYYFKLENASTLNKDDLIIYDNDKIGRVIGVGDKITSVIDVENKRIIEINNLLINGRVFMIMEND